MIIRDFEQETSQENEEFSQVITLDDIIKNTNDVKDEGNSHEEVVKPAGMREILVNERKHTQYIENPLPVPKKKVHKELDYAITVSESDDFDLKDMSGIDYFDIE